MIIDATNAIIGRLASVVAKHALQGETVDIINVELAVITGNRKFITDKYAHRMSRGMPKTGPFFFKKEDRFVRRVIRGMLPYTQPKGKTAYGKVKCHIGVPTPFKDKKAESITTADVTQTQNLKYMTVKELCMLLGREQ